VLLDCVSVRRRLLPAERCRQPQVLQLREPGGHGLARGRIGVLLLVAHPVEADGWCC
jgi:hypothetical protein